MNGVKDFLKTDKKTTSTKECQRANSWQSSKRMSQDDFRRNQKVSGLNQCE